MSIATWIEKLHMEKYIADAAYSRWQAAAKELDADPTAYQRKGELWYNQLNQDYLAGLLDYEKAYLPMYKVFYLGEKVPAGGGMPWLGLAAVVGAAVGFAAYLAKRRG